MRNEARAGVVEQSSPSGEKRHAGTWRLGNWGLCLALIAGCGSGGGSTRGAEAPAASEQGAVGGRGGFEYEPSPYQDAEGSALPEEAEGDGAGERLARGDGGPIDGALAEGDTAFEQGDYQAARRAYSAARQKVPGDPAPYVGLARVTLGEKDIPLGYNARPNDRTAKAALALVEEGLKLDPRYALGQLEKGRILLVLGEASLARQAFEQARALLPKNAEASGGLGIAMLASGKTQEALAAFEQSVHLDPRNPERLSNLGTAYLMLGRVDRAIVTYRRAVELAPGDARAHGDLGTALLAQNRAEEALPYLKRAHELLPERATFISNLGFAHELLGDLNQAIFHYRQALKLDSKLASAWINLGVALAKQGKLGEAEAALKEARALDPDDPRVQANLEELEQLKKQRPK